MTQTAMPLPVPPRTPSPLSSEDDVDVGLGIDGLADKPSVQELPSDTTVASLSPELSNKSRPAPINTQWLSPDFTPARSPGRTLETIDSPMTPNSQVSSSSDVGESSIAFQNGNPFNFTTQQYTAGMVSPGRADLGRRKGHKYKHSSVSHQIIQTPTPRPPLTLPTSIPMPTRLEVQHSLTYEQKLRLSWCLCHFVVAGLVQWSAHGSLAMAALSRLLFFDASGAVVCVFVDMMGNFEVWKRSSLRHPFGLERADVLAGFGMAVFIAFMGLDILSHGAEHTLENLGHHESHHAHSHHEASSVTIGLVALVSVGTTLISALLLQNHARIGRAMRVKVTAGWGRILSNPSHFLTLSCSALLLVLPFLSKHAFTLFDTSLSALVAVMMIWVGARLGTALTSMLLMSYSGAGGAADVKHVLAEIEADPDITQLEDAKFWQVHYDLSIANLRVKYRDNAHEEAAGRLRSRLTRLINTRLGSPGRNQQSRWEVSIQMILDSET